MQAYETSQSSSSNARSQFSISPSGLASRFLKRLSLARIFSHVVDQLPAGSLLFEAHSQRSRAVFEASRSTT